MNFDNVSLLPYTEDVVLTNRLQKLRLVKLILFFLKESIVAIEHMLSKNYEFFDPQVSENLCQIRAYKLCLFSDEKYDDFHYELLANEKCHFKQYLDKALVLEREYEYLYRNRGCHYKHDLDCQETVKDFLLKNELIFKIDKEVLFLIQSHFLTRFHLLDEENVSIGIDYNKLCEFMNISSKTFGRKVVHDYQRKLSRTSCDFVIKLLKTISENIDINQNILHELRQEDEIYRSILPSYETTKVLIAHMLQTETPIIVIVHSDRRQIVRLIFVPSKNKKCFILNNDQKLFRKNQTCVIFKGIVKNEKYSSSYLNSLIINSFKKHGLEKIILANMAAHPQYPGKKLDAYKYNPYQNYQGNSHNILDKVHLLEQRFLLMQRFSHTIGCSKENPGLFLLKHVYFDSIEKYLNHLSKQDIESNGLSFPIEFIEDKNMVLTSVG